MESGNEHKNFRGDHIISETNHRNQSCDADGKDGLVGPFGDSPNKNDRQRRKLLTWLKETQQKREENNKRIFSRWLGMVDKGNTPVDLTNQTSPKKEQSPTKTDFSTKIHSIPYDAFYAMTPVYYTYPVPEYWMIGSDQNLCYYNSHIQRAPTCPCYPYCLQSQPPPPMIPNDAHIANTAPMPPINPLQTDVACKQQEPLQFNLTEWYTTLEEIDSANGQTVENIPSIEVQTGQQSLEFSTNMNSTNSVTYSTANLISGGSNVPPGDFS